MISGGLGTLCGCDHCTNPQDDRDIFSVVWEHCMDVIIALIHKMTGIYSQWFGNIVWM